MLYKTKLPITILIALTLFLCVATLTAQNSITSPKDFFGFQPGSDRMLINYEELIDYLKDVEKNSDRIKLVEIGKSPMDKPIYICFISSAENIKNLYRLKEINKELALTGTLSDEQINEYQEEGKVFVLATLSMHSTEVGPSQSAPLWAYHLSTTENPDTLQWLNNVVFTMVPCHNPDGMDLIVEHYKKYKGTKYEGSSLPQVYHKYVGHDNNRDFMKLTQSDTRAIASIYNLEWFPQVMVEKHQMGSTGVRYFVPPPHDPIAENVDAGIWNWIGIFGSNMMKDMTKAGQKGVAQHYLFDDYWPGSTETCIWKNIIGFLTECSSAQTATPIYVEENELSVWGKGLAEYKKSINMPELWEGGWWKLSDIVDYETVSMYSILKTASDNKKEILKFRNDICKKEIEKGKTESPYYYVLPINQHDQSELVYLIELLQEHGVNVYQLNSNRTLEKKEFQKGDIIIPLSQPFRAFIKEAMESQVFPLRHYTPDGKMIRPYDITSWSLPLHNGVECYEIKEKPSERFKLILVKPDFTLNNITKSDTAYAYLLSAANNESYKVAFKLLANGQKVYRISKRTFVDGKEIPSGSFLVYNNEKVYDIIENISFTPAIIEKDREYEMEELKLPRMALVETNMHDMDAGWTRFVFDTYSIPYTVVKPGDFKDTDFTKDFDMVIFPDNDKSILMDGKYKSGNDYYMSSYPPEFVKGIGKDGMEKLMTFLDNGGTIISWGRSTDLFTTTLKIKHSKDDTEEFQLPVRNISSQLKSKEFYCPGSWMQLSLTKESPLTYGMKDQTGIFYRGRPVFSTSVPRFDMDRRVIGKFPEKEILISGFAENEEAIANKSALVWLKKGKGQLVLFAFQPQFRASTAATYKLLFNAILMN
ncbi:M14 metallopeptidase family protein [Bacteroidota bacterium]